MAFHEFGIMQDIPQGRYDDFEPEKYKNIVAVSMDIIDKVMVKTILIPTFAHTTKVPFKGLNEIGITLIPPDSAQQMADIFEECGIPELKKLIKLLRQAAEEGKFTIHFGI